MPGTHKAGCGKVFTEKASGAQRERPQLQAALEYMRPGDTLVVWKLDRLARPMNQLIETVEGLKKRGIGFRSLTEAIDTTTAGGTLVVAGVFGDATLVGDRARRHPPLRLPVPVAARPLVSMYLWIRSS